MTSFLLLLAQFLDVQILIRKTVSLSINVSETHLHMQMCFHVSELNTISVRRRHIKCSGLRESWGGQTVMPSKIPNFPRTHKGMDAKDSNSASAE